MKKILDFFKDAFCRISVILMVLIPVGGAILLLVSIISSVITPSAPSDQEIRDYAEAYREEWYDEGYERGYKDASFVAEETAKYAENARSSISKALDIVRGSMADPDVPVEDYYDALEDELDEAYNWLNRALD